MRGTKSLAIVLVLLFLSFPLNEQMVDTFFFGGACFRAIAINTPLFFSIAEESTDHDMMWLKRASSFPLED